MAKRAIVIVLDGCGVGEMPDAASYGDAGSNTIGNLAARFPDGLHLPNLGKLGLGNIINIKGVPPDPSARAAWGKSLELSQGKDTTTGHWEIAGVVSETPFPTYPQGFPPEVIRDFELVIGRGTLGNIVASGTDIIRDLGEEHVATGDPIVYTSADSVFQIAAHERIVPLERLYDWCREARMLLDGPHRVGRVIARPFTGEPGRYKRSANRQDFSVEPHAPTILDNLKEQELSVVGIGKIGDIFAHRGLTKEVHTADNQEGVLATLMEMNEGSDGLIFTNLVDTDSIYGHRNDVVGFRNALETFDTFVPHLLKALHPHDLLIITADHGVDPTTPSTDHSREYTPLLAVRRGRQQPVDLGTRTTFADIAATISEMFGFPAPSVGTSFFNDLR